jgi:hypothetical protein
MCGHRTILWETVCTAVACLFAKPRGRGSFPFTQAFAERLRFALYLCGERKDVGINVLTKNTKHCVCSDPKDKIYALLSLLPRWLVVEVEPDYTRNVHEVYRDAALSFIQNSKSQNLNVLTTVENHEQDRGFQSWVPDVCLT